MQIKFFHIPNFTEYRPILRWHNSCQVTKSRKPDPINIFLKKKVFSKFEVRTVTELKMHKNLISS